MPLMIDRDGGAATTSDRKRVRRFFCETRRGLVTQLLFHILESCEEHPALGKVVEEFLWSSWNLHDDERVRRRRGGKNCFVGTKRRGNRRELATKQKTNVCPIFFWFCRLFRTWRRLTLTAVA